MNSIKSYSHQNRHEELFPLNKEHAEINKEEQANKQAIVDFKKLLRGLKKNYIVTKYKFHLMLGEKKMCFSYKLSNTLNS